jgi:probable phosphoglycerate mutase
MMTKKEFYFVRHGQTDHNLLEGDAKGDHLGHIPLNQTGIQQAASIESIISLLPIQTICASPMKRAQQTREIIAKQLEAPHYVIDNLGECSLKIWKAMSSLGMGISVPEHGDAADFFKQVQKGMNQALSMPGPILIVAHGGIHWAVCCLLKIKNHPWTLENCGIVHFQCNDSDEWTALRLRNCPQT